MAAIVEAGSTRRVGLGWVGLSKGLVAGTGGTIGPLGNGFVQFVDGRR
jgi:hypothetical protein